MPRTISILLMMRAALCAAGKGGEQNVGQGDGAIGKQENYYCKRPLKSCIIRQ